MTIKPPTYLILRHGTYYFQIRIPKQLLESSRTSSVLVRRSTRTGNVREALNVARRWTVELMAADFEKTLAEIDESGRAHDKIYRRGRKLFEQLSLVDPNDGSEIEDFLDDISPEDQKALNHYLDQKQIVSNVTPNRRTQLPAAVTGKRIKLSELLLKWIEQNSTRKAPWAEKTKETFRAHVNLMIGLVGDIYADQLTPELLRDSYGDRITKVPKCYTTKKKFKDGDKLKLFDEIIEIAERDKDDRLTPTTVSNYVVNVITFLRWAIKKHYLPRDLDAVLEDVSKIGGKQESTRDRFSDADLKLLFESEEMKSGALLSQPMRYWGLLLGLYTGARSGEIGQLHLEDITEDNIG